MEVRRLLSIFEMSVALEGAVGAASDAGLIRI